MPVDLGDMAFAAYKRTLKQAEEARHKGATIDAAASFRQCAELYRQYANACSDPATRQQRLKKVQFLLDLAQSLEPSRPATSAPSKKSPAAPKSTEAANADDYENEVMNLVQKTHIKWDDIGGLDETKNTIKSAYGLALAQKPKGVQISGSRNILLFGPPGTGKTLLAAATAGSLDATFFNVKVSNLLSKYFGESSKLVTALYAAARRHSPAVIFLDEFESLTPPRGAGDSGAERRIVSTLLAELDGLATKEDESFILTMGATNVPWLLDTAILSRFQRRIYVPLPDDEARKAILNIHLANHGHKTEKPVEEWVHQTGGYSGREIEQICQIAVAQMTQRANPNLLNLVDQGQTALRKYEIKVEPLSANDLQAALDQIHPIATAEMLSRYDEWVKKAES
jgi:SpoVK/Ycf46/Vps4 family AAA+-type ATPase